MERKKVPRIILRLFFYLNNWKDGVLSNRMENSKRGADLEEGHVSNYGHDQVEELVRHSNGYYVK